MNRTGFMGDSFEWGIIGISLLILLLYEVRLHVIGRVTPLKVARTAHAEIRTKWVLAVMKRAGAELLVIQTLRNSVMAASFMASTSVIALTGTLTLSGLGNIENPIWNRSLLTGLQESGVLTATKLILLALVFFFSFMFSTMAVRYFNHAGYLITTEMSFEQHRRQALAIAYLNRAGYQYSMGLRAFFLCIPILASLFSTWVMLPATILLIAVLHQFDHIPLEWMDDRRSRTDVMDKL